MLRRHPTWGCGWTGLRRAGAPQPAERGLRRAAVRAASPVVHHVVDGVRPPAAGPRDRGAAAARCDASGVQPQLRAFRAAQPAAACCAECQTTTQLEVDHLHPPLRDLRRAFLAADAGAAPTEFQTSAKTGVTRLLRRDASFKRRWARFHAARASYQLLCARCNRQKGARPAAARGGPADAPKKKADGMYDKTSPE